MHARRRPQRWKAAAARGACLSGNSPSRCQLRPRTRYRGCTATYRAHLPRDLTTRPHGATFSPTGYVKQTSGTCLVPVTSKKECQAAAKELNLGDTTASKQSYPGVLRLKVPSGCFLTESSTLGNRRGLKYNAEGSEGFLTSYGDCTSSDVCLCRRDPPTTMATTAMTTTGTKAAPGGKQVPP